MKAPDRQYHETMPAQACSPAGMRAHAETAAEALPLQGSHPGTGTTADPSCLGVQPLLSARSVHSRMRGGCEARYRVVHALGIGATGAVFEVRDQDLNRSIALKVLRQEASFETRDSFLAEARIAAGLTHPNVPPILDVDLADDGRPFFTMHQVQGRTLLDAVCEHGRDQDQAPQDADRVRTSASPAALAHRTAAVGVDRRSVNYLVSIGIAVCNGLAYAHAHGIVHQDIKPENLLIGAFGEVLILDWGAASRLGDDGRITGQLYGTPLYMSPEQARVEHADPRSDVYALCATLFHALVGRLPWWDPDPERFWDGKRAGRITECSPYERARLPTELIAILRKGLAAEPTDRYASIAELRRDLEQYQSGLRVGAYRYSPWAYVWRWCREHATLSATSAVAALAALLAWALVAHQHELQRRSWNLVAHYAFPTLAAASQQWRGWTIPTWNAPIHQAALAAPDFAVDAGAIVIGGSSMAVDLTCDRAVIGNVRISWTAEGLTFGGNLNCYIGGTDRTKGLTVHLGGWGDERSIVLTSGEDLRQLEWRQLPFQLQAHHPYRLMLEREDLHLRLWIDGQLVLDHLVLEMPLEAANERFGFDTYGKQQVRISDVRLYRQQPAQLVSSLAIPDLLFQMRRWDEARDRYLEILDSFPHTDLATTAEFRAADCLRAAGKAAEADHAFAAFVTAHARDPLVPIALAQRFSYAVASTDETAEAAIVEELKAFTPHPILTSIINQRSRQIQGRLPTSEDILDHPELLVRLQTLARGYDDWCHALQVVPSHDPTLQALTHTLIGCGQPELVLAFVPAQSHEAHEALIAAGRIAEATALASEDGTGRLAQGRLAEVAADGSAVPYPRIQADAWLGRWDAVADINPQSPWLTARRLRSRDDLERAVASLPLDQSEADWGITERVSLLLALGRAAEVERDYHHASARAVALCALGRCDEALRIAPPHDVTVRILAALDALHRGEGQRASLLIDGCKPHGYAHGDVDVILPCALIDIWAGHPDGARRLLRAELVRKQRGEQRLWYAAAFILGDINDDTFRAQPYQFGIESQYRLCQAVRSEFAGDRAGAMAAYRALIALPLVQRPSFACAETLRWRALQDHLPLPVDWGVFVSSQD